MNRVALYARVSTRDKGQDPANQLTPLRRFAKTQKWRVVTEYVDQDSGANGNRPQFKEMFAAASRREFDVLLFWSLDRFSREGIVPTLTSLKRLSDYGVKWRSFQEPYIDTTTGFGDVIAAFVAKIAELERERIRERIKAGLANAKAKGKVLGRPRLVVNRAAVHRLRREGRSIRDIAATTHLSRGTVHRLTGSVRSSKPE